MRLDLLHLWRNLRRSPASAVAAVLTLALTLGAGASIFAVVDAILLTPPPFADPGALFILGETPIGDPATEPRTIGYATFDAWRERAGTLATLEASDGTNLTLTGLGAAERVNAINVTPGFLSLVGVRPALGRGLDVDDVGRPVVIVSYAFWHGKLGGDREVIGRQIVLGGVAHTIVGVLPERFSFAFNGSDFWRPFPVSPVQAARSGYRVGVLARLAGNVQVSNLTRALDDVSRTSSPPARVVATGVAAAKAGRATKTLSLLAGAAALAMIIAFTNLAGLLIVRSIDRRRELAIRTALGARRSEIARQLLLEAEALVVVGTIGGVILAWWLTPVIGRLVFDLYGGIANRAVTMSWRVIGVVSILAATCAWICGWLPALVASRLSVVEVLRRGATPAPRELFVRRAFVSSVVALGFVLIASLTLLGRSLLYVLAVNPGFEARGVLTLSISLPSAVYTGERVVTFYSTLQDSLEQRFGPHVISIIDEIPLTHDRGRSVVTVLPTDPGREAVVRVASRAYFDVMRIPVVAGRSFDAGDNASAPARAVISESLAERLFASKEATGRQILMGPQSQPVEIIGVVGDVKHRALDEAAAPTVYLSAWQSPSNSNHIVVRSVRPDADVIAAVREEVARLDGNLPVYGIATMTGVVDASPGVPASRVLIAAFTGFALLAVVIGAIGLYGVVAHDVASRRTELALRLALGADPMRLLRRTLWQGSLIVGCGLIVGVVLSIWVARTLSAVAFGTSHLDLISAGTASALLLAVGVCAVLPAALRAARTDPLIALRSE